MICKFVSRLVVSFIVLFVLFPDRSGAVEGVPVGSGAPPIGEVVPTKELANIPISANENWERVCVDRSQTLNGDIQSIKNFGTGQWSVGPAVASQLIVYDFAEEKAGVNQALGVGASFRFYRPITIKDGAGNPVGKNGESILLPKTERIEILRDQLDALKATTTANAAEMAKKENELRDEELNYKTIMKEIEESRVYISQIKQECRQTTLGRNTNGYLAAPMFSITPTIFASEPITQDDLAIQPAILLGFFEDILNVGVGFNLTGPAGQKGNVFLLFGIGAGFNW